LSERLGRYCIASKRFSLKFFQFILVAALSSILKTKQRSKIDGSLIGVCERIVWRT